jgi:hypothetical protein
MAIAMKLAIGFLCQSPIPHRGDFNIKTINRQFLIFPVDVIGFTACVGTAVSNSRRSF